MDIKVSGQWLVDDGEVVTLRIHKPIYGNCVAVNEEILKRCEQMGRRIKIGTKDVSETLTPRQWRNKSIKIAKVFKYPDNPMIMWQGTIGKLPKETAEQLHI